MLLILFCLIILSGCTTTKEIEKICTEIRDVSISNANHVEAIKKYNATEKQHYVFYYEYDSSLFAQKKYMKLIENKAIYLKQHPKSKVFIAGHTDAKGSAKYNFVLGEKRAKTVIDLLIKFGVNKSQIEFTSYGKSTPAVYVNTKEALKYNRRAELFLYTSDISVNNENDLQTTKKYIFAKKQYHVLYYGYNSSVLGQVKDLKFIENKAKYLRKHPKNKVFIAGHTDSKGSEQYNLVLGKKRIKSVVNLLEKFGVKDTQIEFISYGKTNPSVYGDMEKERKYNRRVELFFYSDTEIDAKNIRNTDTLQGTREAEETAGINCRYIEIIKSQPNIAYGVLLLLGTIAAFLV